MELLERYVQAVKNCLPLAARDDIGAEIDANLQAQIDEREAQIGHPVSDDDVAGILRAYGHPRSVAARYGGEMTLIGPALLPFYWHTLRVSVLLAIAAQVIFRAVDEFAVGNGNILQYIGNLWGSIWLTLFGVVGAVTLGFMLYERLRERYGNRFGADLTQWDPRKLPRLEQPYGVKRWMLALNLVFNTLIIAMLMTALRIHFSSPFVVAPPLVLLVRFAIFIIAIAMLLDIVNLIRPDWLTLRCAVRIAMQAGMICVTLKVLISRTIVTLAPGGAHTKDLIDAATALNDAALASMAVFPFIAAYEIYREVKRLREIRTASGGAAR